MTKQSFFLKMNWNKFFFAANRWIGRFMMNGILLDAGYPAINVPAKRQSEFNKLMLEFYSSGEFGPMTEFMKSCLSQTMKNKESS
jgi:hypothetical protein